jgi:cbb3-type cytochrome c oxidase subunit III
MRVLKIVALISLAAFLTACGDTGTSNGNGNRSAGASNNNRAATPATADNSNTTPSANANQSATAATASNVDAAALFREQKCVNCHGEDGKGKRKGTPDFTNAQWQSKESDEELAEQIRKGDPPKMPPFESKLNEEQIKALVAYVRSFAKQ